MRRVTLLFCEWVFIIYKFLTNEEGYEGEA